MRTARTWLGVSVTALLGALACGHAEQAGPGAASPHLDERAEQSGEHTASAREGTAASHARTPSGEGAPGPSHPAPHERIAQVMGMQPEGAELAQLVELVRSDPDAEIREAAVVALANSEDGRAIDALIAATKDSERRVTLAAIELLSWSEDRQARAALESLAHSGDAAIARAASRNASR